MAQIPTFKYQLREAAGFEQCVQALGGHRRLDQAVTGLCETLCIKPEVYPVVDGMLDVRFCRTDTLRDLPDIGFWFRIYEEERIVELLHAEVMPDYESD